MKKVVVCDSKIEQNKSKARAAVWIKSVTEKLVIVKYFGSKEDALMNALGIMSRCHALMVEMEVFYKGESIFHWVKHH